MAVLSALLPCEDGVRAYAALRARADALKAGGDSRSRDQIMADTLVQRITGESPAVGGPVEIGLIMNGDTVFNGNPADASPDNPPGATPGPADSSSAAELTGYGPIPAPIARDIITRTVGSQTQAAEVYIRRLFADPATGIVAQIDPRRRRFTGPLAAYLRYRDQLCRTPYCEAPIRHLDHIRPHSDGGPTDEQNGRGLCERCNHTNQTPGWTAT